MRKIKEIKLQMRILDDKKSSLIKNDDKLELKNLTKQMSKLSLLLESYTEQMTW